MNNIIFDMILLEADRIIATKQKEFDLYMKNKNGSYVQIADAYHQEVETILKDINKRKKLKYFITFQEGIDIQDEITPSANKILRFFARIMSYGNRITGYGMRDIIRSTGISGRYVQAGVKVLLEKDIIRMKKVKNHREYMVNPVYMYKGTMKKLFLCVKAYDKMPAYALDGGVQYNPLEDDITEE